METYKLTVNGQPKEVAVDPGTPLLWVLREELKMTGTKYGCGIAACGAFSAVIARAGRSWALWRCLRARRNRLTPISKNRWAGTSAAVALMSGFAKRSKALRNSSSQEAHHDSRNQFYE